MEASEVAFVKPADTAVQVVPHANCIELRVCEWNGEVQEKIINVYLSNANAMSLSAALRDAILS
jgi:hypothetical protein